MNRRRKIVSYILYIALAAGAIRVGFMGYDQVVAFRSEAFADTKTWLPKQRIHQLMRFHGADVLKVTPNEVFIMRNSKWIPIMRRDRG